MSGAPGDPAKVMAEGMKKQDDYAAGRAAYVARFYAARGLPDPRRENAERERRSRPETRSKG